MILPRNALCRLALVAVLLFPKVLFAMQPQLGSEDPDVGVFFVHERGELLNRGESSHRWDKTRHEYLPLERWSRDDWAPNAVDVALSPKSGRQLDTQKIQQVKISIALKVGFMQVDPTTGLTDFRRLEDSAKWWPAEFTKVVPNSGLVRRGELVIVLQDLDLDALTTPLWTKGLWPTVMEIRVLIEQNETLGSRWIGLSRRLELVAGD